MHDLRPTRLKAKKTKIVLSAQKLEIWREIKESKKNPIN